MNFGSLPGQFYGTIVESAPVGRMATFVRDPSVTFPPQLPGYTDRPA
jgi:hypothetical protein